ncbi:sigma-E factor negative regulatory protein [Sansalvadorimonas sp. 2012CJ34-2]|uniref:Sigma-E factor negative regulatory protein n=1 Tax=Parendozoicomonas callyspongiae TaxID=2942213 RepID=A0ABT0PFN3_9GAMM|nr:sigma-E factor negative regulatory protein [Sansalvadorimonas sp. 2012CJ34-2]MCL6270185.1 sigma-E factor negative regulatory protein [Sansalvadorimonas sp. 2012CJ34-2]
MSDASDNAHMRLRESLSALMDGEANELEMRRVLDRLDQDQDLRETAFSYQRIGETIRNEQNAYSGIDLSSSISAALEDEPVPAVEQPAQQKASIQTVRKTGLAANLGRFAIAASVAVATVVGVQTWNIASRTDNGFGSGTEVASVTEPAGYPTGNLPSADMFGARGLQAGLGISQTSLTPEQMSQARGYADRVAQERFRAYMLEHAEQSTAQSGNGVMPFLRAASFQQ